MINLDSDPANAPATDGDGNMHFTLSYTNTGNTVLSNLRFVDVFPYIGDNAEPPSDSSSDGVIIPTIGDGRTPASDFSGSVSYVSLTGADSVWVTADAPNSVSRDPNRAITATTWCDGINGTVQNPGNTGTGNCPTSASDVTATYSTTASLLPGQTLDQELTLDSEDAKCDDIWTNAFGARATGINLPIRSNDVSVMVSCPFWDLALVKDLSDGQSKLLDASANPLIVSYDLTVANQGNARAEDINVMDTPPVGFTYAGANPTGAQTIDSIEVDYKGDGSFVIQGLDDNEQVTFPVKYVIDPQKAAEGTMTNAAEITSFTDEDSKAQTDVDSTPDADPTNDLYTDPEGSEEADGGESPDFDPDGDGNLNNRNQSDEDDHDYEKVGFKYSLGNQVWFDLDNDGKADPDEESIPNVVLQLFVDADGNGYPDDTNGDGVIDAADAIATTKTDQNGQYLFAGLEEGKYVVGVDPANWNEGGPLDGLLSSGPTSTDPNDDIDGDDNGFAGPDNFIVSGPVMLGALEPTGEQNSNDSNADFASNLTVDFGFYQAQFDLALRKTLADGQSNEVNVGDMVTFNIEVFNHGDVVADQIQVIDYLPAGLELADDDWTLESDGTATTSISTALAPQQSVIIPITTKVTEAGDIDNHAEIASARPIDFNGRVLTTPSGATIPDVDSVPDREDSDPLVDDVVDNSDGDEDDHDTASLRVTGNDPEDSTTNPILVLTGGDAWLLVLVGLLLLTIGGLVVVASLNSGRRPHPAQEA